MNMDVSLEALAYETAVAWARDNSKAADPTHFGQQVAAVRFAVLSTVEVSVARAPDPKPETTKAAATTAPDPKPETTKATATTAPDPKPETTKTASAAPEAPPADAAAPSYDEVARAFLQRAKADRPGALAVVAKFGVKVPRELKPEQYAAFIEEIGK